MPATKTGRWPARSHELIAQDNGTFLVPLTGGLFAVIDEPDVRLVRDHLWCARRDGHTHYAFRGKQQTTLLMHRVILNPPRGVQIDHRDGNGLNNTRGNLRMCTQSQNNQNQVSARGSSSFKGVCWHRAAGKWEAHIRQHGRRHHLGLFVSEMDAARAYNAAAVQCFGDFARLNEVGV